MKHAACGHLVALHDPCSECWAKGVVCTLATGKVRSLPKPPQKRRR